MKDEIFEKTLQFILQREGAMLMTLTIWEVKQTRG